MPHWNSRHWKWTDSPRANVVLTGVALPLGLMAGRLVGDAWAWPTPAGFLASVVARAAAAGAVAYVATWFGLWAYEKFRIPTPPADLPPPAT